ncbi:ammonium transporter (TC 1.A.11) [Dethiosulfatibacter aminovorans DSM 17477]|uniref:Ammonium transporter n=1 Tax=Dethiosulfatibacter aminovorans DSM 17477 TaxID=1121476 RepID=A0A1M6I997_9FIRM|nr:ammonium transporter [Dethiosulfatibacter aminovorans]SHJ31017.1 ammonium transporter (TC 1.A.11) [Dethiosulfatibacter aminovorans DSM 17477]
MDNFIINSMWVLIASVLVFLMHAGFAMVEVGFTQAKNAVNIIMKNFVTVSVGVMCYYFIGYGIMYGNDFLGLFGTDMFMLINRPAETAGISFEVFFFFQAIFAATCATIVSGAMAERTKFISYIIFCFVATLLIYPVIGHWIWGGGFLAEKLHFMDFAGGTAVHAVGGVSALAGAWLVGARKGKYKNGVAHAIPGHNIPLGALGVLILWFGWFGFNPGSTLDITSPATAHSAITTLLSGAAATLSALVWSTVKYEKPDAALTLNGALAGLVGITAGANVISFCGAIIVGLISGILMLYSVEIIDQKLKIDDPVGAISVHGVCGIFGTIAIGLFSTAEGAEGLFFGGGFSQLLRQISGVAIACSVAFVISYITFTIIKKTIGLKVHEHEEVHGLDAIEHGISAYIKLH